MTKYIVSGYIGFDNFGDEAIAKVLVSYLKNIGAEKITLLSSNPQRTIENYGVDSEYFLNFIKPIITSDVLISGGGSLLQDVTSLKSLLYYLAVITTALVFNKKVIIFAQGFTPFRTKIGKFLTKFVLSFCDKIYVRDLKSAEILKELKIDSEIISDPVFAIKTPKVKHNGIGVQLRKSDALTDYFLNILADEISENFKNKKIKLLSLQDNLDLQVLEKFAALLESRGIKSNILRNLTVEECINEISKLEYLIGMRFHSLLVATKSGVKSLGIKYDVKVSNLANTVGFRTVELNQKTLKKDFESFIKEDAYNYKIPEFEFPEL